MKAYSEMARAIFWISTSAVAMSTPTALRTRDRRKPAPAILMMEAMMLPTVSQPVSARSECWGRDVVPEVGHGDSLEWDTERMRAKQEEGNEEEVKTLGTTCSRLNVDVEPQE